MREKNKRVKHMDGNEKRVNRIGMMMVRTERMMR